MNEKSFRLDESRRDRVGLDEAIFCEGKAPEHLCSIIQTLLDTGTRALLTRLAQDVHRSLPAALSAHIDYESISRTGVLGEVSTPRTAARVAVVTAGTSDVGVAREAVRTLGYYGEATQEIYDVGVAGLWRVLERVDAIKQCSVAIVAAGMDGVLPTVVAGLVPSLVIALPVSSGYGVAAGGQTALRTALSSCAPGVVVVNIDNGYGAACAALRALRPHP